MAKALSGIRIIDLSTFMSGPYASMVMGDLGAEVIKVEPQGTGDNSRHIPPYYHEGQCLYFFGLNRNKKGITLDLTTDQGREVLYDLVRKADIVFDNYRPGVTKKLHVDYDSLKAVKPDIISCSISAFGQDGPYQRRPAYDLTIQAISGAMSMNGTPESGPLRLGVPMGDLAASLWGVIAMQAALRHREQTGEGQCIDLTLLECLTSLITYPALYYTYDGVLPKMLGSGHQSIVPFNTYKTKEGSIAICCASNKFWGLLCDALERPELKEDPRYKEAGDRLVNRAELEKLLEICFATRTAREWDALLIKAGVPCGIVNTMEGVFEDAAIKQRGFAVEVPHKGAMLKMFGSPLTKMSATPVEEFRTPPELGGDNDDVLGTLLGYSPEAIARLRDEGII